MTRRTGGQILVDQLKIHGTSHVFCVPGESYLAVLDALHDADIRTIVCRQEGGAAYMAEAAGKITGAPGIVMVTRGPGATNASCGVHVASQDSTPLIMFVGQVARDMKEREAFQEIDYKAVFGSMAKGVAQIDRTDRIPEYIARAFSVATSGRPGPVVLALPEDTLWGTAQVPDLPPYTRVLTRPGAADLDTLRERLEASHNPFLLVGGSGWTPEALVQVQGFAERFDLPVGVSWRRLECFDQRHPNFAGHVGWGMHDDLRERVRNADLLLTLGARLGEATTEGYSVVESPRPRQQLIHVHADPSELGRVFQPAQAICASNAGMAHALASLQPTRAPVWGAHTRAANAAYRATLAPLPSPSAMSLDQAACHVNTVLPADACITVAPATTRSTHTATASSRALAARSRPRWAAWATACRRPSPPSWKTRSARWSATRATAASR